ncbi:MAG: OmpA family protein [Cypionkella sp.]
MKRLINTSTILSLALYVVPPFAAQAQDLRTVTVGDQQVICLPNKQTACPEGALCAMAIKPENCQANAEKTVAKALAAQAKVDAKAKVDAEVMPPLTAAPTKRAANAQEAADNAASDQALAEKLAAEQAATEKAAADKADANKAAAEQAAAEKAAADQAAADKAAKDADRAAKDQAAKEKIAARKAAEKAAAEQAAADQAAADKAAADKVAAATAAADKATADNSAKDKAAADKAAAADEAAADKTASDKTASDKAAADQAAADQALADKLAADQADAAKTAQQPAADTSDTSAPAAPGMKVEYPRVVVNGKQVVCLPDKATECPVGETCVVGKNLPVCQTLAENELAGTSVIPAPKPPAKRQSSAAQTKADQVAADRAAADQAAMDKANIAAARKAQKEAERAAAQAAKADPNVKIIEAPVADPQAQQSLETVLDAPVGADPTVQEQTPTAAAAAEGTDIHRRPSDQPAPKGAKVTTEVVTEKDHRKSSQDFSAPPVQVAPGKKTGLSDLEKVGLVALGALAIGAIINGNKQVVSNTGDRVVVRQDDGSYQVYKDDSSLMRQPGSDVTTQTFSDGSTRSIFTRQDGSQIVTVRDASGRVLQRIAYDRDGRSTMLIDDLQPEHRVDVSRLPQVQPQNTKISVSSSNAALQAALAAANADDQGQKFSLRQIRSIPQVRYLAPTIDVPAVTFETGSAAIQPTEARKLNSLGKFIVDLIDQNPGEVFLVEGYTDAVGSAASNLALSDRRAESVAKALTEYFQVPPENLVVQGYGETDLLIPSAGDERANRRVAVRIITPLLQQASN